MRRLLITFLTLLTVASSISQTNYDKSKMNLEKLDRGVVAIRNADNTVALSWRILESDKQHESFDIYRNGQKLNGQPLTTSGSFFEDKSPLTEDAVYEVKGGGVNGKYLLKKDAPVGYLPIALNKPADGVTPDGRTYSYNANDATVGDVDGDGQYEIVLKWEPSNAHDNSHYGYTGSTIFDCYTLDGRQLWRIDMGKNMRAGAHYIPFIVWDFDGDGKAELMVRTADGTIDGQGNVIGDASKDWVCKEANRAGRILTGPEYLTVFEGMTGKALKTVDYIPERGNIEDWGDNYGNRVDRFLAGVGYLDGVHASGIFCRGYYTRTVLAAWDWDGKELKSRWVFDTNDRGKADYAGQGNHNLRIADVDSDGKDEITYGSMAVDHNGKGLYNTHFGHGDAIHLLAEPKTNKLMIWDCNENKRDGVDLRDAATGKVIFQIKSGIDVGRCMAADIDPTNPGVEMWGLQDENIYNVKGEVVADARRARVSYNYGIWWDGDLLRELLDRSEVTKYNWKKKKCYQLTKFYGTTFNNWTKQNPCLAADILGDWREEVITHTIDNTELRIYVSPIPTDYRINCLMTDIPYRISAATQNVGYNQPAEAGYYIGPDDTSYLK